MMVTTGYANQEVLIEQNCSKPRLIHHEKGLIGRALGAQHSLSELPGGSVLANLAHARLHSAARSDRRWRQRHIVIPEHLCGAKTIASPRTVTLDNEMAHISVTDVRPIINVTAGTANTTGGSTITYTNWASPWT